MPRLPEVVTLHEKTVQAAAEGLTAPQRRRRAPVGGHRVVINDFTIVIHPAVWAVIGPYVEDMRCLQIISPDDVIVHNHPHTTEYPWPAIDREEHHE